MVDIVIVSCRVWGMETCSTPTCEKVVYAKGLCRSHYRQQNGESAKRWLKIKKDPESLERFNRSHKKYYLSVRDTPEFKETHRRLQNKYYRESPKRRAYIANWKKEQPIEKKRSWYRRDNHKQQFDGLREAVIERDGCKCVSCGITRVEHKEKWGQDLNVHHKNGLGRGVEKNSKDNRLDNLITLCKKCHTREDMKLRATLPVF
jgi:5-methylcytosine-specific restriction endonuclease McrA